MGTIRNGANGGFSGKAGSVIGSSWNNISYIKGLPKLSKKPATLKQLDQRARFAAVLAFLAPIKDVLILGWKGQSGNRATGFNMGIQYALNYAITGNYPDYTVDRSLVQLSKGTLQSYSSESFVSPVVGKLEMRWTPQTNDLNAFASDVVRLVIYNEQQNLFLYYGNVGLREDGQATVEIPSNFASNVIHAYIFYVNEAGTRQSNSAYVGPLGLEYN